MKTLKYNLNKEGENKIALPLGAEILSIQNQNEELVLWCNVNSEIEEMEERIFDVDKNNQEVPFRLGIKRVYISTVQFDEGSFVVHVFEVITES